MLTLFAVPKPFCGHIGVIQRNAITSWTLLRPRPQIILLGDDEGTAEIAADFGVQHVPHVARNEYGTPLLNDLFQQAQRLAVHSMLCYVNADIILMRDFVQAVERVGRRRQRFLMVGQRWDLAVQESLDFSAADWETRLVNRVVTHGRPHEETGIDYFVFPRGFWGDIPPFAIGRTAWDNWLVYRARSLRAPVINATLAVSVVHQNHDYNQPRGAAGVWKGPEAERNLELAGGYSHVFTLRDANWVLSPRGRVIPVLTLRHLRRRWDTLPVMIPASGSRSPLTHPLRLVCIGLHDCLTRLYPPRIAGKLVRRIRCLPRWGTSDNSHGRKGK